MIWIMGLGININAAKVHQRWHYPEETLYKIFYSMIDEDNNLVASFYMAPVMTMNADKINKFAPHGQGPNELTNLVGMCLYKGNLALAEHPTKIKIYEKQDKTYKWKETKWLKSGKSVQMVKNIAYCNNKWFLAGSQEHSLKNGVLHASYLKVFSDDGKILTHLIQKKRKVFKRYYMMNYYIPKSKNKLYFISEDEMAVTIIDPVKVIEEKKVKLEAPPFYKALPEHFYAFKKAKHHLASLKKDLQTWKTGYSRITHAVIVGNYLILQVRTCSEELKNFANLIYNKDNFKLEKTLYTDDFLMGGRENKLYSFANGNPGIDEDTDDCIINITEINSL